MWNYLLRRIVTVFLPTLLGISIVVFFIMHLIPGSFVDVLIGIGTDITEEQRAQIVRAYGLDKPLPVQYIYWLGNVVQGDLGTSLRTGKPVVQEIADRLPVTLEIAFVALLMALLLAIPLGIISAVRQNSLSDLVARILALLGLSVPNFLLGTLLILFVSLYLPSVFPTTGYVPVSRGIGANLRSIFLPALALAMAMSASVMRITRSSLVETFHQDYIRVARSKGLSESRVLMGHALRNGLIPVVTVIGIHVGYLLGGTVIIEEIFSLPGIGRLALNAIYQRDYPTVQGTVLFIAFVFVLVNMITDVTYSLIDPRIRLEA
jgi:peptide/nickel transport system permease protein